MISLPHSVFFSLVLRVAAPPDTRLDRSPMSMIVAPDSSQIASSERGEVKTKGRGDDLRRPRDGVIGTLVINGRFPRAKPREPC